MAEATPLGYFDTYEHTRGRRVWRRLWVYPPPEGVDAAWKGIYRVLYVERSGTRSVKCREGRQRTVRRCRQAFLTKSYYITSRRDHAQGYAQGVRGHWLIENRLHWVKDVQTNEDASGIGSGRGAATLSLLKSLTLSLYRYHGYDSLKEATTRFGNKVKELLQLLRT